ncbi:hypothetical protein [Massilia sp. TSP1-1-2]|uniref:DUF7738 domain-containing protein n=1 Tax=Massilia sp. TSP1-1-2 TaxID=2804649 RepID=UPI003CED3792
MAKSHLFGIMFSLILMGCDAQKPFSAAADSSESTTALAGVSINIKDDGIYFSDTKVQLGGTLESWKAAISAPSRCTNAKVGTILCTWDSLGLEVGTEDTQKTVEFVNLYISIPEFLTDPHTVHYAALPPQSSFSGKLTFDGAVINPNTGFDEIRSKLNRNRNVRCGTLDCSTPHGTFSDKVLLFFHLKGTRKTDAIESIGFSLRDQSDE